MTKYHTWTLTYTPAQLQAALSRNPLTQVAAFAALTLDGFDASGPHHDGDCHRHGRHDQDGDGGAAAAYSGL